MIDLDHNATTRPTPDATQAVLRGLAELWHNPSSVHRSGQAARQAVELARQSLANLIGAKPRDIILTGSGTESIDLAICGTLATLSPGSGSPPLILTTRTEHSAVRELAEALSRTGAARVEWIPLDSDGVVDVAALEALLTARPSIVSVQWANNETGVIQPIATISSRCRAAGSLMHCDGTQWVGKMPCDLSQGPDVDFLSFSPHKFHGPKGVGVLYSKQGTRFRPRLIGNQELGRRGGTENVPGILGAGVASEQALAWLTNPAPREGLSTLRDRFERDILEAVPAANVNAKAATRLWNTTNIGFPRLEAEALLLALSERGVAASAGAACSSGSLDPSPVLLAMGIAPEIAHGSIRFSLSRDTTAQELHDAAQIVIGVARRLYASMSGLSPSSLSLPP